MFLSTPPDATYPLTVTKLLCQPGDEIKQNDALFVYEEKTVNNEWDPDTRENVDKIRKLFRNFESELEGTLTSLLVNKGQVITEKIDVVDIEEACKHEVQWAGICANCGKDLTHLQYNSSAKLTERATINTVHGQTQLLVSEAEATRADEEIKRRLLDTRKLSLVVDLDQTIIHATVDPTVAEWQSNPENPNYEAVKDVRAFQLVDDGPGARGCWYYIKLRPGLAEFLDEISKHYELHIYTMGTRAYAENIAKIIDPERQFFGDRILSRDESGSMIAKNLKRLFPVDSKMVVIIDDRGDVWHWSPNLVKVGAYDFFVGIGDINSSFLPKRPDLEAKPKAAKTTSGDAPDASAVETDHPIVEADPTAPALASLQPNGEVSAVERMELMAGNQDEGSIREKGVEQDETIAAQLADRPLLQKQKILDAAEEEAKTSPAVEAAVESLSDNGAPNDPPPDTSSKYRHNLLQDDDTALQHLGQNLRNIHDAYFDEYDRDSAGTKGGRVAVLRPDRGKKRSVDELEKIPDAALIVTNLKTQVLQGVNLVFSGVVPLGVDIHSHDTTLWAKSFGATVSVNITKRTTHVIASPERRTAKVRQAAKRGSKIAIVNQAWLFACFSQWKKVDEEPYRIHSDAPTNGAAGLPGSFEGNDDVDLSSSDEEAALTEDENEGGARAPNGALALDTDVEEMAKHQPSLGREDGSPTEIEKADNWEEFNDELAEFLGSDAEDESDAESIRSESATEGRATSSRRKRKRDGAEDGTSTPDGGEDGSPLQKRKREAMARTTSLTNAANVPSSNGSTPAVADSSGVDGEADGAGELEGDLELDLEAALAAEFDNESDDGEAPSGDGGEAGAAEG